MVDEGRLPSTLCGACSLLVLTSPSKWRQSSSNQLYRAPPHLHLYTSKMPNPPETALRVLDQCWQLKIAQRYPQASYEQQTSTSKFSFRGDFKESDSFIYWGNQANSEARWARSTDDELTDSSLNRISFITTTCIRTVAVEPRGLRNGVPMWPAANQTT